MTGTTKLYLLIGGIALAAIAGYTLFIYNWGHGDGVMEQQLAYAAATPREVRRETKQEPQPPDSGRTVSKPIPDATIQARIEKARQEAYDRARKENESEVVTLWQVIHEGETREARLREPKLIKLETRTLGSLVLTFYPETGQSEYVHVPPPKEKEFVYFEKPVLVRETFWQKVDEYLIAGAVAIATERIVVSLMGN